MLFHFVDKTLATRLFSARKPRREVTESPSLGMRTTNSRGNSILTIPSSFGPLFKVAHRRDGSVMSADAFVVVVARFGPESHDDIVSRLRHLVLRGLRSRCTCTNVQNRSGWLSMVEIGGIVAGKQEKREVSLASSKCAMSLSARRPRRAGPTQTQCIAYLDSCKASRRPKSPGSCEPRFLAN